jgi:hypothetical protein
MILPNQPNDPTDYTMFLTSARTIWEDFTGAQKRKVVCDDNGASIEGKKRGQPNLNIQVNQTVLTS